MRRAILLFVLISTCWAVPSFGRNWPITYTVSSEIRSDYIGGNGFIAHHGLVSQSDIYADLGHGFSADIWASLPLNGKQDGGQEIDYQLEYATKSIKAGAYLIDFAPLEWTRYKGSALMPYIKMYAYELHPFNGCTVSPNMELDHISSFDNHSFDGIMALVNLDYTYQSRSINHEGKLHLVYDGGIFGFEKGFVFLPEINLKWHVGKVLVKLPIVKAAIPLSPISDRSFHAMVGVGASYDIQI